jgi:ubiquinone/menaquinone biosynthesis C-methylase UbiE
MARHDQYFLGHSSVEQRRLQQQAGELADESARLFDQIGLAPGSRAVEIGCGPQGCLELLSSRVGLTGSVVGVELSDHVVQLALEFLAERRLNNVEVRQGNAAATGLPRERFDLATARLVLVNVPEPEKIVAEMAALVRSGGVVALHEADWSAHICDPPLPAWERLKQALVSYSEAKGIDLYIGRRIARMLRNAGLVDVQVNPLIHIYGPDHSRRPIFLQFVNNLHERIVAEGLISEAEFAKCIASLDRHLSEPETIVVSHPIYPSMGAETVDRHSCSLFCGPLRRLGATGKKSSLMRQCKFIDPCRHCGRMTDKPSVMASSPSSSRNGLETT